MVSRRGAEQMQAHPVEVPGVRGAVAVAGGVADRVGQGAIAGAFDGLAGAGGLDWRGVHRQQIVVIAGALGGEDPDQPLDAGLQPRAGLVERVLGQDLREQVHQTSLGGGEKTPVGVMKPEQDLRDGERDDLGVGHHSSRVCCLHRQEIVRGAEHHGQKRIEVGVHHGPFRSVLAQEHRRLRSLPYDTFNPPLPVASTI